MLQNESRDRRVSERKRVEIEALIIVPKRFHAVATIVDLSEEGCQIRLARPIELPERFIIEFNDEAYVCLRRWTNEAHSGLHFVDRCSSAQRRALAGSLTTSLDMTRRGRAVKAPRPRG